MGNGNLLYPYRCNKVSSSHTIDNNVVQSNDIANIMAGNKISQANVFDLDLSAETYDKFKYDQLSDSTLTLCWKKAAENNPEFMIDSVDSLLYRKTELSGVAVFQLVLPLSKRATVIRAAHTSCNTDHYSTQKTCKLVRAHCFWPGMGYAISSYVSGCPVCRRNARRNRINKSSTLHVSSSSSVHHGLVNVVSSGASQPLSSMSVMSSRQLTDPSSSRL